MYNIRLHNYVQHETTYVQHMTLYNMRLHTCIQHDTTYVKHMAQDVMLHTFSVVHSLLYILNKVDKCYAINQCAWAYDEHEYHMLPVAIKRATELHLFIHSVSSLVESTVTVAFDSII